MHWRRQMLGTCPGALWYPVLEGECDMRVPQVSERVKEAPAQALRAMFAGIGQLLAASDKLRGKSATDEAAAEAKAAAPKTVTPETVTPETVTPETVTPETVTPETATPKTVTPE